VPTHHSNVIIQGRDSFVKPKTYAYITIYVLPLSFCISFHKRLTPSCALHFSSIIIIERYHTDADDRFSCATFLFRQKFLCIFFLPNRNYL